MHRQVREIPWERLSVDTDGVNQYQVSKFLTVPFTRALAQRLAGSGVTANAADPGFVPTGLGRGATGAFKIFLTLATTPTPARSRPARWHRTTRPPSDCGSSAS